MTKTVEEIIAKIQTAIDDPNVIEISDLEKDNLTVYGYNGTGFFDDYCYKIYRKKLNATSRETLTEFKIDVYAEKVLKFLNTAAKSKLASGKTSFELLSAPYSKGLIDRTKISGFIDIKIDPKNGKVKIYRTDRSERYGSISFDSINDLITQVFSDADDNRFAPFQDAIGKAIVEKNILAKRELKGSKTRLENATIKADLFKELTDAVPDSIKLLMEVDEL